MRFLASRRTCSPPCSACGEGARDRQPQDHRAAEGDRGARRAARRSRHRRSCIEPANPQVIYVPPTTRPLSTAVGLSGLSAVLLAPVSGLLPGLRPRERLRIRRRHRGGRRDLRQLQLGRRRCQHQREQGRQHRPQLQQYAPSKGGNWKHDAGHRQGVAYRDNASRDKYAKGVQGTDAQHDRGRTGSAAQAQTSPIERKPELARVVEAT